MPSRSDPLKIANSPDPPGAGRWIGVAALALIALVVQGCTLMSLGVLLPHLAGDFGGRAGAAATALLIAMSLANLPVGWAVTRIDARLVLLAGVLLAACGWAGAAMAPDRLWLGLATAVAGVGIAASTIVPGIAIITRDMGDRRGLALALFLGATIVAGAIVPPLAGLAIERAGWRGAMLLGSGTMALLAGLPILLIGRGAVASRPEDADAPAPEHGTAGHGAFLRILIAMTLLQIAINGVLFAAVDGLMQQGLSQATAIAAYSLANLAGLPALLLGGLLVDRVGARPAMTAICLLLALGSAALLAARPLGMAGVAAFILLWGVASALPGQAGSMLLADNVPRSAFARRLGLLTAFASLVGALAPLLTDQLRGAGGGYAIPILLYAALALAAAPVVAIRPPRN